MMMVYIHTDEIGTVKGRVQMASSKKTAAANTPPQLETETEIIKGFPARLSPEDIATDPIIQGMQVELPSSPNETYVPSAVLHKLSTSTLVSSLFRELKASDDLPLSTKEATSKVVVDTKSVILSKEFNEFDRSVLEAVLSQLAAGNRAMTNGMIFRALAGKNSGFSGSEEMLRSIDESMTKCMYTPVYLPLGVDPITGKVVDYGEGQVLPAYRRTRNVCGKVVSTYELQSIPIVYAYCRAQNAVTFAPIEMVAVPISATKRSLAIQNFLQRTVTPYIFTPKGDNMINHKGVPLPDIVVHYDSLYALAAAQDQGREKSAPALDHPLDIKPAASAKAAKPKYSWFLKDKTRETVGSILDHWQGLGLIEGWENKTKGRAIYAVHIHLFRVDKKYLPLPAPQNPVPAI